MGRTRKEEEPHSAQQGFLLTSAGVPKYIGLVSNSWTGMHIYIYI